MGKVESVTEEVGATANATDCGSVDHHNLAGRLGASLRVGQARSEHWT
jgi:hypothetical protein